MQPLPQVGRLPSAFAIGAGVAVAGLGAGGLTAWAAGLPTLLRVRHDLAPLTPGTSAALLLAGAALVLLTPPLPGPVRRWSGQALAAATVLIGLLGLLGAFSGERVSPIRIVVTAVLGERAGAAPPHPSAAFALVIAGIALAALQLPRHGRNRWVPVLAPAAATIAFVTLLAYVLQRGPLPGGPGELAMPALSAAGILLLAVGVMLARPTYGLLRPFSSRGPGGTLARRLTPTLMLLPFGIAGLSTLAVKAGAQPAVALSASSALLVLSLVFVVGGTARVLDNADATQRQVLAELAAERDYSAALVQSLNEGVVVFDRDLRIIDVNSRWCRLVSRPREELIGQRPPYSWQPDDEARQAPAGLAFGNVPGGSDQYVRGADGRLVPVLATMAPVLDEHGRPRAFLASYVDITERKRVENVLAERAEQLELANAQLRDTNRQLEEAAEFKSDLMAMVSHEVSQPLSSVASLAELLANDWSDLADDVRLELAEKIDKNTRRLTSMINDMLLLFRLDAGAVSARRATVPIAEVVETVTDALPASTIDIVTSIDPELCALVDRGHLWQVLTNLVGNAVKYGEPPVEIGCHRRSDGMIITVRDHGKGIPEEFVPRLFDRFTRARTGGVRVRGSGLGLFIVRHLIEVNGGSIWYERAEPRGARLVVRLEPAPLPAPAADVARPLSPSEPVKNRP